MRSAILTVVAAGSGVLIHAAESAAQGQALPKPGTVLQFTVTRTAGARAPQSERTIVTIRATEGETAVAEVATQPSNLRYVTRTYRGLFTFEVAETGTTYRHDFDAAALRRLWPLVTGGTATISGRLLAAPATQFKPGAGFRAIGTYTARFTVRERLTVIMAAGPFDVFVVARAIERRDPEGRLLQRETGDTWYAPRLGWQVRAATQTAGPQPQTTRIELIALEER